MARKRQKLVHVGVLHHKHGSDIFVGWTVEQVYAKVYEYVKEWWGDFCPNQKLPTDKLTAVSAYFEAAGDSEYLDMLSDTVPV